MQYMKWDYCRCYFHFTPTTINPTNRISAIKTLPTFTCLGLTTFDSQPSIYVIILASRRRDGIAVETGINTTISNTSTEIENKRKYEFVCNIFLEKIHYS